MISARVSSQEDFMQSVMPITMPMMFVSGVFYPIETMPWIFQKIAYILPLTYVNDALRAVMLKGVRHRRHMDRYSGTLRFHCFVLLL